MWSRTMCVALVNLFKNLTYQEDNGEEDPPVEAEAEGNGEEVPPVEAEGHEEEVHTTPPLGGC